MKKLVIAAVAAYSMVAAAAGKPAGGPQLTDAEKAAKAAAGRQRMLERTGGVVMVEGTGQLTVVNCQKKISLADVKARTENLAKVLHVKMTVEEGSWTMGAPLPKGANAALYVVDDPKLPMSLVASEARWGVVNVAEIDAGARFNKAFIRGAIKTFGAGVSQFRGSPMQPVSKPEDLDKVVAEGLTYDALAGILGNLKAIGVTMARKASYRKACQEGWAAQPTNAIQKAVWDEVHSLPKTPIKIEYNPKTDK